MSNNKYVCQMMECVVILERLINEEYEEKAFDNLDKKWGELKMSSKPYDNNLNELVFSRDNVLTEKDDEQVRMETNNLHKRSHDLRTEDIEKLFSIMNKNILSWWD